MMMTVPLPPLPSIPGVDATHRPPGRSIIDVLDNEHHQVATLCEELLEDDVSTERRQRIASVVVAQLSRHVSAERQYLYPTVRALLPDGDALAEVGTAEDTTLLHLLKQLEGASADDPYYAKMADEVATQFHRHRDTATEQLLQPLREAATDEQLIRLGNRIEMVEEAAPTRPHPGAPTRPPWNAVVDPALGVIDKTRDVLTRRTTYVEDL
jgi:hemerythrin superfamily protein